jgi:hypothetical protein
MWKLKHGASSGGLGYYVNKLPALAHDWKKGTSLRRADNKRKSTKLNNLMHMYSLK